jgi:hypothetical protein
VCRFFCQKIRAISFAKPLSDTTDKVVPLHRLPDRPALSARELAVYYQRFQRITISDALNLTNPRG